MRGSIQIVTAVLLGLLLIVNIGLVAARSIALPRLTGYGCEGSIGVLYANEEGHFPRCDLIVRTDPIRGVYYYWNGEER